MLLRNAGCNSVQRRYRFFHANFHGILTFVTRLGLNMGVVVGGCAKKHIENVVPIWPTTGPFCIALQGDT